MDISRIKNYISNVFIYSGHKAGFVSVKTKDITDNKNETITSLSQWEINEKSTENVVKWDLSKVPLSYFVCSVKDKSYFLAEFKDLVDDCFIEWARASLARIRFIKTTCEKSADIIINWDDQTVFGRDYECGHNNLKVVGNWIEKADIHLIVYPLFDHFVPKENRIKRMKVTILHEIGHSLGLKHSTCRKDIMYHRISDTQMISQNDIEILNDLYRPKESVGYTY